MLKSLKINILFDKIYWKIKQKYSQIRCFLSNGHYIYSLDENTKFISCNEDKFSHILYVCKGHEKVEIDWCCRWIKAELANQTVIDCGANIGYFSAVIAQRCSLSQILAIEGNSRTANLCQQNLDILNIKNVRMMQAVLSDNSSEHYTIPNKPGREPWQQAIKINSESCDSYTTTLDNLVSELKLTPSLVKIDCEGFETRILKGSNHLLNIIRPAFMIECNDNALYSAGSNRHELFSLLAAFNYKLFHLASFSGWQPFGIEVNDDFPVTEFNLAAIPNDNLNLQKWNKSNAFI